MQQNPAQEWIETLVRLVAGAESAVLVIAKGEGEPPAVAASWLPAGARAADGLLGLCGVALSTRRPVVRAGNDGPDAAARDGVAIAFRLADGGPGALALELSRGAGQDPQHVLAALPLALAYLPLGRRGPGRAPQASGGSPADGEALDLLALALAPEAFQASATAVVTDLATRVGAERVSLGLLHGHDVRIAALSHSAHFDERSQLVADLARAMEEALDQQRPVLFLGNAGEEGAGLRRAHAALSSSQGGVVVHTLPLVRGESPVGALSVEWPPGVAPSAEQRAWLESLAPLLAAALGARRGEERSALARAAEVLRAQAGRLLDPADPRAKWGVVGALVFGLLFAFLPVTHRVTARATLEGTVQRVVVAPIDGFVAEAHARAGDVVRRGDVLAVLDDADLRLARRKSEGKREEIANQHRAALAGHDRAEVAALRAALDQAEAELALLDDQLERTRLVAPFDGVVARGDLSQALGAPTRRGEVLFEVASLDGYRILLDVDERDIADVALGSRGRLTLGALPDTSLPLVVSQLTPVATASGGRNFFRVEARLEGPGDALRPGMEGIAKVDAGRRGLAWVVTHGFVDWLRLWAWSWLP